MILHAAALAVPVDGRQSEMALDIARGTRRLLRAAGWASVTELALPSGRRADIVALSGDSSLAIVEIKSSLADFRADRKWQDYRFHCDQLFFAVSPEMPAETLPPDAGLIVADAFGAEIVREAPVHRLAGATRRTMLLRFAVAAADRLHALADPAATLPREL
ncbi:MAG: MmcB family DNA repair protein [Methylobacteriaceae bacterium]|nr:MmcB family DNA repair protein [Methylobacteriaceae bacterium]